MDSGLGATCVVVTTLGRTTLGQMSRCGAKSPQQSGLQLIPSEPVRTSLAGTRRTSPDETLTLLAAVLN